MPPRTAGQPGLCERAECQNGAPCVELGARALCQCLPGFGGPKCEKLLSVNFVDRDTYLQFTDLQDWPRANITLQVRAGGGVQGHRGGWHRGCCPGDVGSYLSPCQVSTAEGNGILLYNGDSDHMAVELYQGHVRVSYDPGTHPSSAIYRYLPPLPRLLGTATPIAWVWGVPGDPGLPASAETINDGQFHTVELVTFDQMVNLSIDGGSPMTMDNSGKHYTLNSEAPLYVGGRTAAWGEAEGAWEAFGHADGPALPRDARGCQLGRLPPLAAPQRHQLPRVHPQPLHQQRAAGLHQDADDAGGGAGLRALPQALLPARHLPARRRPGPRLPLRARLGRAPL